MRIDVETDVIINGTLSMLAAILGVSEAAAWGHLCFLWTACQKETEDTLTAKQVNMWSRHPNMASAITEAEFGEALPDGRIVIRGARKRFEFKQRGRAGGLASAAARRARTGTAIPTNASNRSRTDVREKSEPQPNPPPNETEVSYSVSVSKRQEEESSAASGLPSPRQLAEAWNEHRHPSQPEVKPETLTAGSKRWNQAKSRLADNPSMDYWVEIIKRIAASNFCRGDNDRGWRASFGFLVQPETHIKATEGAYDNRKPTTPLSTQNGLKIVQFDENGEVIG